MIDDSLKETEAFGKRVGNELKTFIKEKNNDYVPIIKDKIAEGLNEYYTKLQDTITNELLTQETQQKSLMDSLDKYKLETENVRNEQTRILKLIETTKLKKIELKRKALIFNYLRSTAKLEKNERKVESQIIYTRIYKLKKDLFDLLKTTTTFKPIKDYDKQIKEQTDKDLTFYKDTQVKEKEELLKLIYHAEEKLKHENKKKIQTKLLLDQIVLRGVSAMNLQALNLSNNSLKGKIYYYNLYKKLNCRCLQK